MRSVYGAFGTLNLRRLHALDGSGYEFIASAVAEMDTINPQIAARLATPLTRWKKFDPTRQRLMRDALNSLLSGATQELSKDLFEIVSKSLDQSGHGRGRFERNNELLSAEFGHLAQPICQPAVIPFRRK